MAAKTVSGKNLTQAYNGNYWSYDTYNPGYAGYANASVLGVMILRFEIPNFVGVSEYLEASVLCDIGVGAEAKLRWALCTSDANKESYQNTKAAVSDSNQIASGTATFSGMNDTVETKKFKMSTTKIKGGTYYLFLWAYNETGISLRPASSAFGNHAVVLGYNVGAVRVKTSAGVKLYALYVKTSTGAKQMIPYVMTASGPKPGG